MGYIRVRSPLLAESLLFSFPVGTEMVHFPTLSSTAYVFSGGFSGISQRGFPHSETPGSKLICSSPGLIAAYRVLHRLLVPRHSPYTLSSLTIRNSSSRLAYAMRQLHAHCVCVVGKTTVCKIFSCQRTRKLLAHLRRFAATVGNLRHHQVACQPELPKGAKVGEYRARTGDLLVANQALSQLS